MNLDHESVNLEGLDTLAPEVRQWYSFPENKTQIKKFVNKELVISKDTHEEFAKRAQRDTLLMIGSLTVGAVAYAFLLMPAGEVIRNRLDAKRSPFNRAMRRFVPFAGLALPFIMVRGMLSFDNGYRN